MDLAPKTLGQALQLALMQKKTRQLDLAVKSRVSHNIISRIATDRAQNVDPRIVAVIERTLRLEKGTLGRFLPTDEAVAK